jgi:hypothetical protein
MAGRWADRADTQADSAITTLLPALREHLLDAQSTSKRVATATITRSRGSAELEDARKLLRFIKGIRQVRKQIQQLESQRTEEEIREYVNLL